MTVSGATLAMLGAAALSLSIATSVRAGGVDSQAERQRIATERRSAEAQFDRREHECRERFAVTACVDQVRGERRETLGRLNTQENLLDEAQRKQRAAQRMTQIREKLAAQDTPLAPSSAASTPKRRADTSVPRESASAPQHRSRSASPAAQASAGAHEAHSREAYEARQESARKHRAEVEARNAERQKQGKTFKPLALPAPASATLP